MSNQVNSMNKGLTVKDLVTTGIFTALLFVFVLVGGVFFATNPVLTFFMPAGGGLLAGPIYLLLIAKVHKRWSLSIMGVIMGIIWFVTGMHWAFALGYHDYGDCRGLCCWCRAVQKQESSTACLISCSLSVALVHISCSLLTPTAGRRPCWVMELNRVTSTPCRQLQIPAS